MGKYPHTPWEGLRREVSMRVKKIILYEAYSIFLFFFFQIFFFTADMLIDLKIEAGKKDIWGVRGVCCQSSNKLGVCHVGSSHMDCAKCLTAGTSMAIDRSRIPRNVGQSNLVRAEGSV